MPRPSCRVLSILRDGHEVDLSRTVVGLEIRESLDVLFGTFRFTAFARRLENPIAEAEGKVEVLVCDGTVGGTQRRFVGLIDEVKQTGTAAGTIVTVSGRSYAARVVHSQVDSRQWSYTSGLGEVVAAICDPLGVKTTFPQEDPVSGEIEFGAITVFDAIKHIASCQGLAMRVEPDGETIAFMRGAAPEPGPEPDHIMQPHSMRGPVTVISQRRPEIRLDDWQ